MTNQVLNVAEEAVLSRISHTNITELARNLVRFPSFKEEETELSLWLASYFGERGYDVEVQEVGPGRLQTIATLRGSGGGRSLMFNGHIDIDPLSSGWERDPFELQVDGDLMSAAGIINMKAGDTAMITAAEAIRTSGVRLRGDLVIACVVGELQGGIGTVHLLEQGIRTDMALVPEPDGSDYIKTTTAGVMNIAVTTIGKSEWTGYQSAGVDAIAKMGAVVSALRGMKFTATLREDLPDLPLMNIGGILGGRGQEYRLNAANFVSDRCTALIDLRFLPDQTAESVRSDIDRVLQDLKKSDPELEYEIEIPPPARFGSNNVTFPPTDVPADSPVVEILARSYERHVGSLPKAIGAQVPTSYGGADVAHLWQAGIHAVIYGPTPGGDDDMGSPPALGAPGDAVSISDVHKVASVLALSALEICGTETDSH
ncbi:M20 family metallopeptidase [Paenarthrobacter nicotinovorans]|uniref:M20 family metallopeptidase n=1 Tax=Paenarthrobacter nicotinovorans TaxID=29320 RepID=UPI0037F64878